MSEQPPQLEPDEVPADQVCDEPMSLPVVSTEPRFVGRLWSVRTDRVLMPDGETVERDIIDHPGAVGVVAMDEHERVLLVQQYRHPTDSRLWEPPAGLLDDDSHGERAVDSAARELFEESGYRARVWNVLVDFYTSPGASNEALRIYLARDVRRVPASERFDRFHEEAGMMISWVPLDLAVTKVLSGELHNPTAVTGVLALAAARNRGLDTLREGSHPWPERGR